MIKKHQKTIFVVKNQHVIDVFHLEIARILRNMGDLEAIMNYVTTILQPRKYVHLHAL